MPNRILKESICTSDSVDGLTWFEEVLFYRLIVNCDDYGRFDGRTAVIKNRLFPLKDNLTLKNVSAAINNLARSGLVALYEFEGKPYLYLPGWDEHQTVRAKRSKYPEPVEVCRNVIADENICNQMHADVPVIQSNTKSESESISESNSNTPHTPQGAKLVREQDFEAFWALYPKKKSIGRAKTAWNKLNPSQEIVRAIMEKLPQLTASEEWKKDGGQYIPYPASWLNAEGWRDEVRQPQGVQQNDPYGNYWIGESEIRAIANLQKLCDSIGKDDEDTEGN